MKIVQIKYDGETITSDVDHKQLTSGSIAAIGNFDGVHLGHQSVINSARELAIQKNTVFGVITFSPHPRKYFAGEKGPQPISPDNIKSEILQLLGASFHVIINFDYNISNMPAEVFVEEMLEHTLNLGGIITGLDFRFGRKRSGDVTTLLKWAKEKNKASDSVAPFILESEENPVSSSRIREALVEGKPEYAQMMLGRKYFIRGLINEGQKRGRTIGFPTMNIDIDHWYLPRLGVYAISAKFENSDLYHKGIANIGYRPTFDGNKCLLEVHLFDFSENVYGKIVTVEFERFIRDERKFANIEELTTQIKQDCEITRTAEIST